jgi:hypothetical protein
MAEVQPLGEPRDDRPEEAVFLVEGLADAIADIQRPQDERRLIFAKGENYRHIRHAQILERWPILAEAWARKIEHRRISSVDRTPGAATFGR